MACGTTVGGPAVIGDTLTPTVAVAPAGGTLAPTEANTATSGVTAGRTAGGGRGVTDGAATETDAASGAAGPTIEDRTEAEMVVDAAGATGAVTLTAAAAATGATTGDGTDGTTTVTGAGMGKPSAAALNAHEPPTTAADSGIALHKFVGAPIAVVGALCKRRRNPLSPQLFISGKIVVRCGENRAYRACTATSRGCGHMTRAARNLIGSADFG
jgi:hypothetical protein